MYPMFSAALFVIDKIWKQPKYPSIYEWITKNVKYIHRHTHTHTHTYIYTHIYMSTYIQKGILFSHEGNLVICNNMDGP